MPVNGCHHMYCCINMYMFLSQMQSLQSQLDFQEQSMVEKSHVSRQEAKIRELESKLEFEKTQVKRLEVRAKDRWRSAGGWLKCTEVRDQLQKQINKWSRLTKYQLHHINMYCSSMKFQTTASKIKPSLLYFLLQLVLFVILSFSNYFKIDFY